MEELGDYTVTPRVLRVTVLAVAVGAATALVALALVRLIGLVTNLVFYGRVGGALSPVEGSPLPAWARLLVPVAGGLVVGVMARWGSERIRGHGMPETIEVVLTGGSRVQPRVAVLKPLSAAVSIGTGGPFGAEGPIIMTGGAVGSILAQLVRLSADERKTLLVAGSAGGMAAIFDSPLAALLLAVELLLFELRPRSVVPVGTAVATATVLRGYLLGRAPLFPVAPLAVPRHLVVYLAAVGVGVLAAVVAGALSRLVYASEDAFGRLPLHWMWWPAIGGLVIGVGGLVSPRALGVGYATIGATTATTLAGTTLLAAFLTKSLIWSLSLGSGTSGGVVAPVLFVGATGGALLAPYLPGVGVGFWPAVGIAALLGASLQIPLTALVFALEVTHAWDASLPMLCAVVPAYLLTTLLFRRSILTEKVARKGFHVNREYDVDPLSVLRVREVAADEVVTFEARQPLADAVATYLDARAGRHDDDASARAYRQRLYPVLDDGRLVGAVTRSALAGAALGDSDGPLPIVVPVHTCGPDETLREVAHRMADLGVSRLVITAGNRVLGVIALADLLAGRLRDLDEARVRERILRPRMPALRRPVRQDAAMTEPIR